MGIFRALIDDFRTQRKIPVVQSIDGDLKAPPLRSGSSWSPDQSRAVLEEILKVSGLTYRVTEKSGRVLFIFEKCPYHTDDDGHTYECCVIWEADGRYGGSCKHDDTAGWKGFKSVIGWDRHIQNVLETLGIKKQDAPVPPQVNVDEELQSFNEKWSVTEDDKKDTLLCETIQRIVHCPALERNRALEKLKTLTGFSQKTLEAVFAEQAKRLKKDKKKEGEKEKQEIPRFNAGLHIVRYATNADLVNKFFDDVINVLKPTNRFFHYGSDLVYVLPGGGLVTLTDRNLSGVLSSLLEIAYCEEKKDEDTKEIYYVLLNYGVIRHDLGKSFVQSPRVLNSFPELKHYARSPFFDLDWNFVTQPGYHPKSCTYYDGPVVHPVQSVQLLTKILADFFWKSPADVVNYLGALITGLTILHWPGTHPMIVYNGNRPGVGKSLLSTILGIIIDGKIPVSISYNANDEEFEKQLATRVRHGDSCVVIDNAKKTAFVKQVESQTLERSVTDPILNFRRLGANEAISRPNTILFSVTMNFALLSRDLRRRSLPINLEQPSNVRHIVFPIGNLREFVYEHRLEILAELAGMIFKRLETGRLEIEKPARHSISQTWAESMDGILRCSGFHGFLDNFDESEHAFDPDYALLIDICESHHAKPLLTPSEWAAILIDDALSGRLRNRKGDPKPKRAQQTIVGTFLSAYVDVPIKTEELGSFRLVCQENGAGHSKQYGFVPLEDEQC